MTEPSVGVSTQNSDLIAKPALQTIAPTVLLDSSVQRQLLHPTSAHKVTTAQLDPNSQLLAQLVLMDQVKVSQKRVIALLVTEDVIAKLGVSPMSKVDAMNVSIVSKTQMLQTLEPNSWVIAVVSAQMEVSAQALQSSLDHADRVIIIIIISPLLITASAQDANLENIAMVLQTPTELTS